MAYDAFDVLHAAKAFICKERRDSYADRPVVDEPEKVIWETMPAPVLEEMDWLAGPEGMDWLNNLRVSDAPFTPKPFAESASGACNDENLSSSANTDRRHAMLMATNDVHKLKATLGPPPNRLPRAPRTNTMPAAVMQAAVANVSGHPSTNQVQQQQQSRSFSFSLPVARAVSVQSSSSFNCGRVQPDSSSFSGGPPVRSGSSFSLGTPVQGVSVHVHPPPLQSQSGPVPPTMSRTLSRGPPANHTPARQYAAAAMHRSASARRAPANFGDELLRDVSLEVVGALDDGTSVAAEGLRSLHPQSGGLNIQMQKAPSRRPASVFWRPPPEAAVVCESMRVPSFVSPPKADDASNTLGRGKPPMVPIVAVPSKTRQTAPMRVDSFSSQASGSFVAPLTMSRDGFPTSNSFLPPPRVASNSFAPSPRQI